MPALAADEPPKEWIDADTGHRVLRLSTEPGSLSLYFHQNAYTPDGQKLLITTPTGLSAIDLKTRAIEKIVDDPDAKIIVTGRKSGDVYYTKGNTVYAINTATKKSRQIATLPKGGTISTVNADETLLGGTITQNSPATQPTGPGGQPMTKAARIDYRFNQHLPMCLLFIETATGRQRTANSCNDWLNHLQFSPTDPTLLMFCHEGPWHDVDRTWTIKSDGTELTQIHKRTMEMEIAGHEFFGADGKWLWYDLQTPRGEDFWLGGYNVENGQRMRYHLQRDEWSVHFNVSPDGSLFAGDGGGPGMVAHAKDGQWIYLFRPELIENRTAAEYQQPGLIKTGVFRSERLVNMSKHDYSLEPNVTFTPDMKWIVFRSNMYGGTSHVYAVELKKN
ncbi:MAG TPA: oligogalacturonate lyase family protein [Tepidisphaeraceae bacterium]